MSYDFELLTVVIDGRVATLTLDRPERHNAFNLKMAEELRAAWETIQTDPEVVCVIVTGAGEKAFCTGMDVADVASGEAKGSGQVSREEAPDRIEDRFLLECAQKDGERLAEGRIPEVVQASALRREREQRVLVEARHAVQRAAPGLGIQ